MKLKLSLVIAVLAVALAAVVAVAAPSATAAKPTTAAPTEQLTATYNGFSYVGTFNVTSFKDVNGVIEAIGTFTGTATDPTAPLQSVTSKGWAAVQAPLPGGATNAAAAAPTSGSCPILDLTLGPLHLDLLGLVVDLNQIHLTITAEPGSGNLLGNLLCQVAGLLDNTGGATGGLSGLLQQLTNLLNQILAAL